MMNGVPKAPTFDRKPMLLLLTLLALYSVFGGTYYLYRRGVLDDFGLIAIPLAVLMIIGFFTLPQLLTRAEASDTIAAAPETAQSN
jgi:hypothetical protein